MGQPAGGARAMKSRKSMKPRMRKNLFSAVTPSKIPDVVYKQLVSLIARGPRQAWREASLRTSHGPGTRCK